MPEQTPMQRLFAETQLLFAVSAFLTFNDVVRLSHVNVHARTAAQRVVTVLVARTLGRFLSPNSDLYTDWLRSTNAFFSSCGLTGAAAVGSLPLFILSYALAEETPPLSNLNVLAPLEYRAEWHRFLRPLHFKPRPVTLRKEFAASASGVHEFVYRPPVAGFQEEQLQNSQQNIRYITVTFTLGDVTPTLLASRCTAQMNFLTSTVLGSFYPALTSRRIGLLGWPAAATNALTYTAIGGPAQAPAGVQLFSDTTFLGEACGFLCPRLWRSLQGLRGVGIFQWTDQPAIISFHNRRYLWRLHYRCSNPTCPYQGSSAQLDY
ncbi:hypothetical protein C8J57DRAFT_1506077 [Mycena rebaudengoi]|nr:hypothetical protein C8J57DRAFT_1506077 [Mycena rebaudengoi]